MNKNLFYFELPNERIAQNPVTPRDHSRLMALNRQTGDIQHHYFYDLVNLLHAGDVLVVNNSKVIPARIFGKKQGSGGNFELILLKEAQPDVWECLAKPGKRLKDGVVGVFEDSRLQCEFLQTLDSGNKLVKFNYSGGTLMDILADVGNMPLPHYITDTSAAPGDYQTVYAKIPGSSAAPTAGLHFTPQLIDALKQKGVQFAEVTLHVGLGTFRPVKTEDILDHKMHTEFYSIDEQAAGLINAAKARGARVISVGTTSTRTLESAFKQHGEIKACSGETDIFIYPGCAFNVIDALITNFHLPESTLIMLVSAFATREFVLNAYKTAIEEKYRFYSFGDAMFLY